MPTPTAGFPQAKNWELNDILCATIEGDNEGTPWATVFHYHIATVGTDDKAAGGLVKDALVASWLTPLVAFLTDQWNYQCITITRVAPTPRGAEFFPLTETAGDVTTDGVPNGTSLVMRKVTDGATARTRGRIYLCGLPEAATNGGLLTAAAQANFDGLSAGMVAPITDDGYNIVPCVFSRAAFNELPNDFTEAAYEAAIGDIQTPLDEIQSVGNLGSQRDRRRRRNTFG